VKENFMNKNARWNSEILYDIQKRIKHQTVSSVSNKTTRFYSKMCRNFISKTYRYKNRHEVNRMASFKEMIKKIVSRKCYKSSEETDLVHISAFSASLSFLLFFKVLLLRKHCYQNKRKFSSKPGSIPPEKNFDFSLSHWKLHNRLIKHTPAKCYHCTFI
jgi:hypothetical protein